MSAYVVEAEHVVYLVEAAVSRALARCDGGSLSWLTSDDPVEWAVIRCTATAAERVSVGNMLWAENVKSVSARYADSKTLNDLPGNGLDAAEGYMLTARDFSLYRPQKIDPVQVLKSCSCFRYHSCEHDGWKYSEACRFIESLEHHAIAALPGYEDAVWGAPSRRRAAEKPRGSTPVKRRPRQSARARWKARKR